MHSSLTFPIQSWRRLKEWSLVPGMGWGETKILQRGSRRDSGKRMWFCVRMWPPPIPPRHQPTEFLEREEKLKGIYLLMSLFFPVDFKMLMSAVVWFYNNLLFISFLTSRKRKRFRQMMRGRTPRERKRDRDGDRKEGQGQRQIHFYALKKSLRDRLAEMCPTRGCICQGFCYSG